MLVRFDSKAGSITMFGDVAVKLLRMMGQSGELPGAILAADIPQALERLRQRSAAEVEKPETSDRDSNAEQSEPKVTLRQRAFPLIELLERAAKRDADVVWDEERRTAI